MLMSAPERPIVVRAFRMGWMCPVAGPWMTARENRLSLGSSTMLFSMPRPVTVPAGGPPGFFGGSVAGDACGAAGGAAAATGAGTGLGTWVVVPELVPARVPGGSVIEASSGFSISIVPPHLAQRVLAR